MADLFKQYLSNNYEKAEKNITKEISRLQQQFIKQCPNADMKKFYFKVDVDKSGTVTSSWIYFEDSVSGVEVL